MSGNKSKSRSWEMWSVIALCFLMVCVVLGFCSSSKGLYITAITEALDISRSAFSVNDSLRYISTAVVNLFFGSLIVKFGEKKLICAGFICLILSALIYSFAREIYVFYLGGVFLGIGLSWTTTTMVGYIVGKWCREKKGTIMGAVLAANGIGAAIAMQIVSPMIYRENDAFGYRIAYRVVALILLVVGVLIAIFLKEKPKDENGQQIANSKKSGNSWAGIPFEDAVRKPYFYLALVCIFLTGMLLQGLSGVAAPHMYDKGLSPAFVAAICSVHSILLSCSKFFTGFMYDRFALKTTSFVCMVAALLSFSLLCFVGDSAAGKAVAGIYSVLSPIALPLETVMLPIYAADLFGEKSYNRMLGIFASVNTAGYAVGTPLSNLCYDLTGDYRIAFVIGCVVIVGVIIIMHYVIQQSVRLKSKDVEG